MCVLWRAVTKGPLLAAQTRSYKMEPVTVTVDGAKKALGIGTTKLYELIQSEDLKRVKIGKRTLITVKSIKAFAERLEAQ